MKSYIIYGLAAAILFAASATVSLYYLPGKTPTPITEKTAAAKTSETPGKSASEPEPAERLRPLVKSAPADTEQAALLLQTLRDRERSIKEKEEQLGERRKLMELVYQDIRGERAGLDDLRKQIGDELRDVSKRSADADKRFGDLDKEKQRASKELTELQKRQTALLDGERKNVVQIAKVYESMAPESAARIIQQMADSGHMDTVVMVLSQMRERQAAGILDQITDAGLAAQLTDKLRTVKRASAVTPAAP